jgi:hypothetical protein
MPGRDRKGHYQRSGFLSSSLRDPGITYNLGGKAISYRYLQRLTQIEPFSTLMW